MNAFGKVPKTSSSVTTTILSTILVTTLIYSLIVVVFFSQIGTHQNDSPVYGHNPSSSASHNLQSDFDTWLRHLIQTSPHGIRTERTACRELEAKAQTCVFEGVICANISSSPTEFRPVYYFVDDTKPDGQIVTHDSWCRLRAIAGDPRTFGNRQWPMPNNTFVPQRSCITAYYRTTSSLFGYDHSNPSNSQQLPNVRWYPSLHSVLLSNQNNDHNYHLLVDIYWLLDLALFQKSLDLRPRPGSSESHLPVNHDLTLFDAPQHYYMAQSKDDFIRQTRRDENRLTYALIMQKDARKLYSNLTDEELHTPSDELRPATPLLDAFPELVSNNEMIFHGDMFANNQSDLVCTARLTVGAKIQDTGHERVCRHIREKSYELYGLQRPPVKRVGRLIFPQPPKSILVLNRHVSRRIGNPNELLHGLKTAFEPLGVEVKYATTENLKTAEQFVRVFSSAGVIIAPHGGQNIGALWMQRFSVLIEVMPSGYVDYAYEHLAQTCKVWYFEMQSEVPEDMISSYEEKCGKYEPHRNQKCNLVKFSPVWVNVQKVVELTRLSLEYLGYETGSWVAYRRNSSKDVPPEDA